MLEKPKLIQGLFPFKGQGLKKPTSLGPDIPYTVPSDKRAQMTYFRAGNSTAELIYVAVTRNGLPMRYFPIGCKSAIHVHLAVVEDLHPGTLIDVLLGAPAGLEGELVLDIGFLEF